MPGHDPFQLQPVDAGCAATSLSFSNAKRPGTNVPGRFAPINTFLEIAKTFAAVGSRPAEVTTPANVIYSAAKMVRSFAVRRMREEPS